MGIINSDLVEQYASLHGSKKYGITGHYFWPHIQACIIDLKPNSILEYGCGQSNLFENLDFENAIYHRYDPGIAEFSKINTDKVGLIINTDVLEHIPEEDIDNVLQHMKCLSSHVFFNISTCLAKEILPNGKNAHCTVWSSEKWLTKIQEFFPEAVLCYANQDKNCLIITWKSPVSKLINQIELYRIIVSAEKVNWLKKFERRMRKLRNSLIDKERFRAFKKRFLKI